MSLAVFDLSVFGAFRLQNELGEPIVFPARTASGVLAYMALAKGKWVPRREMASAMWPDQDGPTAMSNLRTAIHRVKKTLGAVEIIEQRDTDMRLILSRVSTDLDRAERLHRAYLFASSDREGVEALKNEWDIRKAGLLTGWEFEWLDEYRATADFSINDIGCDLARAYETIGENRQALEIWHAVMERTPFHVEALKNALRLEYSLNGRERALVLADQGSLAFSGVELPAELSKTIQSIRSGVIRHMPAPELLRTRSEILLLANMFESSLRLNRTEALALLARECTSQVAQMHPRTTLSLLTLALNNTDGVSPERIKLAAQTAMFASLAAEFDIGHLWSDFVMENATEDSQEYGDALSIKGFMCFEQRRYEQAFEFLEQAIKVFERQGKEEFRLRALSRMAGVQWHLLRFDEAIESYQKLLDAYERNPEASFKPLMLVAHGNLCFVYAMRMEWKVAISHGYESELVADVIPSYRSVFTIPYSLALFATGEHGRAREMIQKCLRGTCREGMYRFNQIALDFAGIMIFLAGREESAQFLFEASEALRSALRHHRSPAEADLIEAMTGLKLSENRTHLPNILKGQPATVLSEWACEQLELALPLSA